MAQLSRAQKLAKERARRRGMQRPASDPNQSVVEERRCEESLLKDLSVAEERRCEESLLKDRRCEESLLKEVADKSFVQEATLEENQINNNSSREESTISMNLDASLLSDDPTTCPVQGTSNEVNISEDQQVKELQPQEQDNSTIQLKLCSEQVKVQDDTIRSQKKPTIKRKYSERRKKRRKVRLQKTRPDDDSASVDSRLDVFLAMDKSDAATHALDKVMDFFSPVEDDHSAASSNASGQSNNEGQSTFFSSFFSRTKSKEALLGELEDILFEKMGCSGPSRPTDYTGGVSSDDESTLEGSFVEPDRAALKKLGSKKKTKMDVKKVLASVPNLTEDASILRPKLVQVMSMDEHDSQLETTASFDNSGFDIDCFSGCNIMEATSVFDDTHEDGIGVDVFSEDHQAAKKKKGIRRFYRRMRRTRNKTQRDVASSSKIIPSVPTTTSSNIDVSAPTVPTVPSMAISSNIDPSGLSVSTVPSMTTSSKIDPPIVANEQQQQQPKSAVKAIKKSDESTMESSQITGDSGVSTTSQSQDGSKESKGAIYSERQELGGSASWVFDEEEENEDESPFKNFSKVYKKFRDGHLKDDPVYTILEELQLALQTIGLNRDDREAITKQLKDTINCQGGFKKDKVNPGLGVVHEDPIGQSLEELTTFAAGNIQLNDEFKEKLPFEVLPLEESPSIRTNSVNENDALAQNFVSVEPVEDCDSRSTAPSSAENSLVEAKQSYQSNDPNVEKSRSQKPPTTGEGKRKKENKKLKGLTRIVTPLFKRKKAKKPSSTHIPTNEHLTVKVVDLLESNPLEDASKTPPHAKITVDTGSPMNPFQSAKAKREAWLTEKKKAEEPDDEFDIILTTRACDDDWGQLLHSSSKQVSAPAENMTTSNVVQYSQTVTPEKRPKTQELKTPKKQTKPQNTPTQDEYSAPSPQWEPATVLREDDSSVELNHDLTIFLPLDDWEDFQNDDLGRKHEQLANSTSSPSHVAQFPVEVAANSHLYSSNHQQTSATVS